MIRIAPCLIVGVAAGLHKHSTKKTSSFVKIPDAIVDQTLPDECVAKNEVDGVLSLKSRVGDTLSAKQKRADLENAV